MYTITAVHNFIRKNHLKEEDIFVEPDLKDQSLNDISINGFEPRFQPTSIRMNRKRNEIAKEM